jgi:hypothetical protein
MFRVQVNFVWAVGCVVVARVVQSTNTRDTVTGHRAMATWLVAPVDLSVRPSVRPSGPL